MTNTSLSSPASLSYSLNNASSGLLLEFRIMNILFVMSVTFSEVDMGSDFGMNLQDIVLPLCPHCHKQNVGFISIAYYLRPDGDAVALYQCNACHHGVVIETPLYAFGDTTNHIDALRIYPEPIDESAPHGTPPDIADRYREAVSALNCGIPRAACMMARNTLEAVAVERGALNGSLVGKLRYLAEKQIISPILFQWAEEIREFGNAAAHDAERKSSPTLDDAADVVNFTEVFLYYVYTLPTRIAEVRRRR